jgi:hypothetical protein
MGAIESAIRWTPYGPPLKPGDRKHPQSNKKNNSNSPSPSNSTSNLSPPSHDGYHYDGAEEDDDFYIHHHSPGRNNSSGSGGEHGGTSVLMGANAPPLYDACLIGRWEEVLTICGADTDVDSGGSGGSMGRSMDVTEPTCCSSSGDIEGGGGDVMFGWNTSPTEEDDHFDDGEDDVPPLINERIESTNTNHPCLQTRYADRRRNTPIHLACRRQPPPSVIRALLNHSPCGAASRRTADGLTPLHFAAYCGAGVEVVSMLVDRIRSDAAVGRAVQLASRMDGAGGVEEEGDYQQGGSNSSRWRIHSEESMLPPTRLLDRRQRTPLHCACTGFRTPSRPSIVRKLLSVDSASATLADERGRTPLSLLFDDYAEEVMEALEEDVSADMLRKRTQKGGELHECWKILKVLLQAAYQGSVSEEDDEEEEIGAISEEEKKESGATAAAAAPQDRLNHKPQTKEVNVVDIYDQQKFSMVHAAAGVWECPAPLAKLVLKCLCGASTSTNSWHNDGEDWNHNIVSAEEVFEENDGNRIARQPDEENMRLPLHIAVCARPQDRSGYSARVKYWLSSPEASIVSRGIASSIRRPSVQSLAGSVSVTESLATRHGRSSTQGRVYNPRFGRSSSRDGMVAFSTFQHQSSFGSSHGLPQQNTLITPSSSTTSMGNLAREPFLQHTMVRDVLALYPGAASVVDDRTGKLPIVLAVETGKSWETAVGPLLDAFPKPFGGDGDGGMALPDDSEESVAHRKALQAALLSAISGPEAFVREESIRTAGRLAKWSGVFGMQGALDGIVSEWIDVAVNNSSATSSPSPEGIIVGPGASSSVDWVKTQTALLRGVAEVVSNSRAGSVSDRVARLCLDCGREFLFAKDSQTREAAARVLGAALGSVGDSDDASSVMRELVLNMSNDAGSLASTSSVGNGRDEDVILKHGKLLALTAIISIKHGSLIMGNKDISDAIIALLRRRVKDKNTVVRSAAYRAIGPVLGKSPSPDDPKIAMTTTTTALKELRSDILKGTRATEQVEVQLALARGLISACKMHPCIFLCKAGMPVIDAALMLAMSSSTARPNVQKAFQVLLWVALQIRGDGDVVDETASHSDRMSAGLEKYIDLAAGENGSIMINFVTRTLAKIESVDEQ